MTAKQTRAMKREYGGYECPVCQSPMSVLDSRTAPLGGVRRRRECKSCSHRITTYEFEFTHNHKLLPAVESLLLDGYDIEKMMSGYLEKVETMRSMAKAMQDIEDGRFGNAKNLRTVR